MGPSLRTPLAVRLVRAAVAITLTVAGVVAVVPPPASATSATFFPQTSFAIDGNSAGPLDFLAPYGPGTTPGGYPTTGLYYDHRTVDMGGTSGCAVPGDDVAGSGVKVMDGPIWVSGGPAPNAKTDLDYIDVAAEKVNVVNQIHDILYIGYEKCGGTGTWQAMLYLDDGDGIPPSAGDNGDYLFLFSFAPSSGTVTLSMYRRIGGAWTAQTFPADSIEGAASQDYGEVALDLTHLGIIPDSACTTINVSGQGAAVTGGALTSAVKDLIAVTPLTISNCGALNVTKLSATPGLTTASPFHYTVDQAPQSNADDYDIVHDSTLAVNLNGSGSTTEPDTNYQELDANITIGGTHNWTNVISQPDYKIAEDTIPAPWTLKTITCTYTDIYVDPPAPKTVTIYENGAYTTNRFLVPPSSLANVPLPPASCTITNQAASLTLNKVVVNDNGGTSTVANFTLTAKDSGGTTVLTGPDPDGTTTTVGLSAAVKAGTYTLSESTAAGYTPSTWTCTGGTLTGSTVVVPDGAAVVCSITNNDIAPKLTLLKTVVNDNGGTAVDTDFTLTATGPLTASGKEGDAGITAATVSAGTYTLSESGPAGYSAGTWSCTGTGGTLTGSSLVLALGADVTCSITNNDLPGQLTLVKTVTNDAGGTAVVGDWTLTGTGPTTVSGTTGAAAVTNAPVDAGSYVLSESGPTGYAAGAWSCTGGTLTGSTVLVANGASVTCTINNNDIAPKLTLLKTVVNDNGGTAVDTDWTLTAAGPVTASGKEGAAAITAASVSAGTYTLSESGPGGYAAGAWSCTGGGTLTGSTLVLPVGADVTCTIVNNDIAPKLTLHKTVVNDAGGTAVDTDFTLTATGPNTISGSTGSAAVTSASVTAGSYLLSESGPTGYAASVWTCTAGGTLTGSTLVLPVGADVSCTVTNNDIAPKLTLLKTVVNDNGGTAVDTDWTLTAAGPVTASGKEGAATVTAVPVQAGTYTLSESGPGGYSAGAWSCTGGGTLTGSSLTLALDENVTCTITNNDIAPKLTLLKTVVNDSGGTAVDTDWTLTATGPLTASGKEGDAGITAAAVSAGTYTLSESGPAGYHGGSWSCTGGGTLVGDQLTLGLGESVTCEITNDDQPATMTLVKHLPNDDGGTATVNDFTLTAVGGPNAGTTVTGISGTTDVTAVTVPAGTYTLSETTKDGYTASTWTCTVTDATGAVTTTTGDTVTVLNGGSLTCEITNDDQPAQLTLLKTVILDDGGTALDTAFQLTATGTTMMASGREGDLSVTGVSIDAGTYALTESGPPGYTSLGWSCEVTNATGETTTVSGASVTLVNGGSAICTVTNDDNPPSLTLVKSVINNDGGTGTIADFPLSATGPVSFTGISGQPDVTNVPVDAGVYTLSESTGLAGYTASAWSCDGGSLTGAELTLALGESAVCTITNDDQPATLTLDKILVNDNGGTATSDQFTLTADGTTPLVGTDTNPAAGSELTSTTMAAGTYTLSETQLTGYTSGAWSCEGGTLNGDQLTITNGTTVICTITNDDQPATLTLLKTVINDNGGSALDTDFTLTATGPRTASGHEGEPAITSALVDAGSYTLSESALPGYTLGAWTCTGGTLTGSTLVLANGESATCEVTNDDQPAHLTLVKEVTNDDGGDATPTSFTLDAAGPTGLSGVSGSPEVTAVQVEPGDYALSETGVQGYTAGSWSCTGGTQLGSSVHVALGEDVTCTIVNDDQPVDLVLTKDDGGITAAHGMAFDYTITVRNAGTRDVDLGEPVTVTDVLPAKLQVVALPSECTQSGQVVTCSVDPALLPAGGDPVVLTLTVVFDPSVPPGTYTNRAYVSTKDDTTFDPKCPPTEAAGTAAGGPGAVALGNADNNVDCEPTPLKGTTGLSVVKSIFELAGDGTPVDSDGTVDFGDSVMYTMAVTPTGDSTEKDVVVTDVVPAGMSVDLTQVGCLDDGPCAIAYDAATRTITWRVGDLMPGETASVYFIVTVDPAPVVAAGQTYERVMTNVAAARSTQTPATPSNEVTTKASATVLPHTGADLGPLALLGSLTLGFGGLLALVGRPRRRRSS